jgi:hypothetical protein
MLVAQRLKHLNAIKYHEILITEIGSHAPNVESRQLENSLQVHTHVVHHKRKDFPYNDCS